MVGLDHQTPTLPASQLAQQALQVHELQQCFQELLEVAAALNIIDVESARAGRVTGLPLSWVVEDRIRRARENAQGQLSQLSSMVHGAVRVSSKGSDATTLIREINKYLPRCEGYICALRDVGVERSAVANAAKTKSAKLKTNEIKDRFLARRWTSKSQAATVIAGEAAMSVEVVRRQLTKLFPGDDWKKPRVSSNPPAGG